MTPEMVLTLVVLVFVITLFVFEWVRVDVVGGNLRGGEIETPSPVGASCLAITATDVVKMKADVIGVRRIQCIQ